jgi:hypothetical protein
MASPLVTSASVVQCSHAGQVTILATDSRVRAAGQPVVLASDTALVAGCPFLQPPPVPSPCLRVQWVVPAARVRVGGRPVLVQASTGLGLGPSQAPQGPVVVVVTQPRVRGL